MEAAAPSFPFLDQTTKGVKKEEAEAGESYL